MSLLSTDVSPVQYLCDKYHTIGVEGLGGFSVQINVHQSLDDDILNVVT